MFDLLIKNMNLLHQVTLLVISVVFTLRFFNLYNVPSEKDDRRLADHHRLIGIKDGKVAVLSPWYKVPRLIPEVLSR